MMEQASAMKKAKPIGLGKGLGALIPRELPPIENPRSLVVDDGTITGATALIEITKIRPNRYQPRQDFDAGALEELTRSIREKGLSSLSRSVVLRMDTSLSRVSGGCVLPSRQG